MAEVVDKMVAKPVQLPAAVSQGSVQDTEVAESISGSTATGGIHVIVSGDTLSKVAAQYGISLNKLQAANPSINPRALQIGQKIVIPAP